MIVNLPDDLTGPSRNLTISDGGVGRTNRYPLRARSPPHNLGLGNQAQPNRKPSADQNVLVRGLNHKNPCRR